jgi:hypothetical protein
MAPDSWAAGSPDALLDLAWRASGVLLALIALLVLQILVAGWWFDRRRRHNERLRRLWEPVLADAANEVPIELPMLAPRDAVAFLQLWNYIQELLLDDARVRLTEVARRVGADRLARRRLVASRPRDRLVAIIAVGLLRDETSWSALEAIALDDASPIRSLAAARSLFRIDPERAAPLLIPGIAARPEWSLAGLAGILAEAGPDAISAPLAEAARLAPSGAAPRLIRLLQLAHGEQAVAAVRHILAATTDTEVITACLRVFEDPRDLDTVRTLLDDPRWQVRLQAVAALARMGTEQDEPRMVELLEDREWWVRYRAAQGLAGSPFMTADRLHRLARELPGRFARDILGQVIAEREFAC